MAATRRLQKELAEIRGSANRSFRVVQVDETNLLIWQGLIVPEKTPYNKVYHLPEGLGCDEVLNSNIL